jgi:spore maturation protein CgeB
MAGAPAVLNIHGPVAEFRDGLSTRTFEAAGAGAVQLIDRPEVCEFYEPGAEVVVFEGSDDLVELTRRAVTDRAWAKRLRDRARARTLAEHTYDARIRYLIQGWSYVG